MGKALTKRFELIVFDWDGTLLDSAAAIVHAIQAASADLAASEASLENVRVSLVAEVAQNYVEFRAYQSRLAIARANLASQSYRQEPQRA